MTEIAIVTTPVNRDLLSTSLRMLTHMLVTKRLAIANEGLLGGRDGYGVQFENETFLMHPDCSCGQSTCWWCDEAACGCPHPEPEAYLDGVRLPDDDWYAANRQILHRWFSDADPSLHARTAAERAQWAADIAERDRRLTRIYHARVHTCAPAGLMADRPRGADYRPTQTAPHFWHKPSGLKVWWYKWIGRSQEIVAPSPVDLPVLFAECLASIGAYGGLA